MMSKGVVQAEELRGQLGDRLVGALKLAAGGIDKTTGELSEMLKRGEVISEDFLPKFAKALLDAFGTKAQKASNTLQSNINKLNTAFIRLSGELDDVLGLSEKFKNVIIAVTGTLDFFRENIVETTAALGAFSIGLAAFLLTSTRAILAFGALATAVATFTTAIKAMNFALLLTPGLGTLALFARLAIAVGAGTVAYFAMSKAMDRAEENQKELVTALEDGIKLLKEGRQLSSAVTKDLIKDTEDRIKALELELEARRATLKMFEDTAGIFDPGLAVPGIPLEDIDLKAKQLKADMKVLVDLLQDFQDQLAKMGARSGTDIPNKEFENSERKLRAVRAGGQVAGDLADAFAEVGDILDGVSEENLAKLLVKLREMGHEGASAEEIMVKFARSIGMNEEAIDAWLDRLEDTPDIMREARQSIDEVNRQIAALNTNAEAMDKLERGFDIRDKVTEFAEEVAKANIPLQEQIDLIAQYQDALIAFDELEARLETLQPLFDASADAADSFKTALKDLALSGESAIDTLINLFESLVDTILDAFLQISITNPLQSALDSFITTSSLFGSGGGSTIEGFDLGGFGTSSTGLGLGDFEFQHGGSFKVGGTGGPDSAFVPLRLTPGETGVIFPPGQEANFGGGGSEVTQNFTANFLGPATEDTVKHSVPQMKRAFGLRGMGLPR
jgi:hypothetical protein